MMEPVIGGAIAKTFTWLWKHFGKEFAGKKWAEFVDSKRFEQAAVDYSNDMHERYGTIKILGMDSPVPLEGIYTRVSMLDKPSSLKRIPKEQLEKAFLKDCHFGEVVGEPKNGLDVFFEKKKLYILGKPGAGKTTFLKYIILQTTKGKQKSIPICIELRRFADTGKTLMEYIVEQFDICSFPDAEVFIVTALKHGKALVLCDGLDEVNKDNGIRDRVIDQLRDFSDKYNQSRFVITCRIAATEYNFEKFDYVEMADFDQEQIEMFIGKWFSEDDETRDMFLSEFKKSEHQRLQELASSPLLLTLLCLSFKENLSFPSRRSEIYGDALEALMKKWDTTRNIKRDDIYRTLSAGRKMNMLARIAAESYEAKDYLIEQDKLQDMIVKYLQTLPQADAPEDIDGEAVLKAVEAQHGILVERTQKLYSFSHKTFQEYLTAKYIVDNAHKGTLKVLIDKHLLDDNWREIILLTAEMLDDADSFFELFYNKLDEIAQIDEELVLFLRNIRSLSDKSALNLGHPQGGMLFQIYYYGLLLPTTSEAVHAIVESISPIISQTRRNIPKLILALCPDVAWLYANSETHHLACSYAFLLALERGIDDAFYLLTDPNLDNYSVLDFLEKMIKYSNGFSMQQELIEITSFVDFEVVNSVIKIFSKSDIISKYLTIYRDDSIVIKYIFAIKLLLDCLANAAVSDREGLKDRLLSPPVG